MGSWPGRRSSPRPSPATRPWRPASPARFSMKQDAKGERSEEHTSELQSQSNLVCRLLLEKKKKNKRKILCLPAQEKDYWFNTPAAQKTWDTIVNLPHAMPAVPRVHGTKLLATLPTERDGY